MPNNKSDQFEDEEPTRPETPSSKSGKYRACFLCSELMTDFLFINEKCVCQKCFDSIHDGTYSIIKK